MFFPSLSSTLWPFMWNGWHYLFLISSGLKSLNYSKSCSGLTSQINSPSQGHGDKWGLPLLWPPSGIWLHHWPGKIWSQVRLGERRTHTHTKKKKKRKGKERHLKMDICEKTKETNSFWMHLKDSQQTEWTEFCIFASHSWKGGVSQPRQSRHSQTWGHAVLTWSSAPFKSMWSQAVTSFALRPGLPSWEVKPLSFPSRNRCKDKQSCRMKSSWSSGKVELHRKLAGGVCGSAQGDFPSPQVGKGRLSPVYTQEYTPCWVQILAPPIFKTLNPLSLISSSAKSSTCLRLFWGWKKILCIKHGTWPLMCA